MRDGTVYEGIVADQGDVRQFERAFRMTFKTALAEALFNLMAFTSWCALTREGRIKAMTWEEFDKACVEVIDAFPENDEPAIEVGVDPTNQAPSAGA
jgi:hypothetical protein